MPYAAGVSVNEHAHSGNQEKRLEGSFQPAGGERHNGEVRAQQNDRHNGPCNRMEHAPGYFVGDPQRARVRDQAKQLREKRREMDKLHKSQSTKYNVRCSLCNKILHAGEIKVVGNHTRNRQSLCADCYIKIVYGDND